MSQQCAQTFQYPIPPMFFGKKEKDLVKQVNDEIIERVVGQQILYFPIDMSHTNFHTLYGEAIEKTFLLNLLRKSDSWPVPQPASKTFEFIGISLSNF